MQKLADIRKFEALMNGSFWDSGLGQVAGALGQGAAMISIPAIALGSLAAGNHYKRQQMQTHSQPPKVERMMQPEDVPMDPRRFLVHDEPDDVPGGGSPNESGTNRLRNASMRFAVG